MTQLEKYAQEGLRLLQIQDGDGRLSSVLSSME